ncbi:hypothetical protein NE237_011103 [Protea cynaroides]|uniref:RRM domain-containing protein n=1 Tax=Protea cynaroides TaxID=273540 RepID=A0A9Q0JXM6_9MAGN|nr:hypothetical protein NE237_011103 [Protea cynaroides]
MGNICKTGTREALKEKLKHYGAPGSTTAAGPNHRVGLSWAVYWDWIPGLTEFENIDSLTFVKDSNSEGMNYGFAFLKFPSRSDCMDAYKQLLWKKSLYSWSSFEGLRNFL